MRLRCLQTSREALGKYAPPSCDIAEKPEGPCVLQVITGIGRRNPKPYTCTLHAAFASGTWAPEFNGGRGTVTWHILAAHMCRAPRDRLGGSGVSDEDAPHLRRFPGDWSTNGSGL